MKKIIVFLLILVLTGCASFRKKFVREKKREERPRPVVYFKDYSNDISFHDLYKKHFLFWKYWEMELINALEEDNHKKQLSSIQQAISHLKNLESYLVSEKQKELISYRETLENIEPRIKKGMVSRLERMSLKREIEKHLRILEKELMYHKMEKFIKGY
ncbi:MAG: hypothetical protein NC898_00935 [Candidatus Omnitrophica bacterium]|nr:hypothetical protein [Candidatus Omnitrophota bacterium]MCM8793020.1 hypothetical protein [Candidatus Omnitrophota bacterium]